MTGRLPLIASIIVIAILIVSFGLLYETDSGRISNLNSSVSSQQSVIAGDQSTITQLRQGLSTLQGQVSTLQNSLESQIATLQGNVSSYQTLIGVLRSTISSDEAKIASLQGELSADNSTIASLNGQIATAKQMISNLTTTVNLQYSKILLSSQSVTIFGNSTTISPFLTFAPTHAGYLLIQVSGASEAYLVESNQAPGASNPGGAIFESVTGLNETSPGVQYFIIPLVPGTGDSFALISNYASDGTATVTVTYFY
jgi:uncharacterized coiled-coil protein SlyX